MVRGLSDLETWKAQYDQAYLQQDYSRFSFYAVAFSEVLPVVACGVFHPQIDFDGRELQIITRGAAAFDHMAFNLTTLNGVSVATFGWTNSTDGPSVSFVGSFRRLPDSEKATAAIQLAFEHLENTYIRHSWWNSLPGEQRAFALSKFKSGVGSPEADRSVDALMTRPFAFSSANVVSHFR